MTIGETIIGCIKSVRFHKEERKMLGTLCGTNASNYVAQLDLPGEVIVVIDSIAAKMHPDWEKKTDSRAATLEQELRGKKVKCKVVEIIDPRHIECELLELINGEYAIKSNNRINKKYERQKKVPAMW